MRDVYSNLTDRIVAALENGVQPWFKPWQSSWGGRSIGRPLRANGKPYRGINVIALWIAAEDAGYGNPYWMTYKQAKTLGAFVRKGEKGTEVVYANRHTVTDEETGANRSYAYLRTYTVFNCEQIEGLPEQYQPKPREVAKNERIEAAEAFTANLGMDLRFGGDMAFYSPSNDRVQMPEFDTFDTAADYYCTLNHETVHWTKAEKRLDRDLGKQRWGDAGYAMEELVAELGSVFLAADLGIVAKPRAGHASYIAHWLKVMKDDKRAIFTAASHAEKAVKYLHEKQPGYVPDKAEAE